MKIMNNEYHIAVIPMLVKKEKVDEFILVFNWNAEQSRKEEGVLSFEALQNKKNPSDFLVIEVYKTPEDQLMHRNTPHFEAFKRDVSKLLIEPYIPAEFCFVSNKI